MSDVLSREQLLQAFARAYEQFITTATEVAQHGVTRVEGEWGPREIVAHMAGWEVMASVRIPRVVAGMPPGEFADEAEQIVMNDAINAAFVTLIGEQSLTTVCDILRRTYQQNIAMLRTLDDQVFQPGQYVYERTLAVIDHCQEHIEMLEHGES